LVDCSSTRGFTIPVGPLTTLGHIRHDSDINHATHPASYNMDEKSSMLAQLENSF
jgi:hypothetical protein